MVKLTERDILIWLDSLEIGYSNMIKIMEHFQDLTEIWMANNQHIYNIKGIKSSLLNKVIKYRSLDYYKRLLDEYEINNIRITTILDDEYPSNLKLIDYKPIVLYMKGSLHTDDNLAIGIVGSRKATPYGRWACEKFTKELVQMGVTIVSGLALGIDAVAHKVALEQGGRTIGILGNGLDTIYPKQNRYLYEEMEKNCAILSEFPLGVKPLPYNFPRRNRIIAGLSLGIVVIEAKEKSGSLITAHQGLEQGKDVFSLPGNINSLYSGGTNKLIKDGAKPLLDIEDIIEEIHELKVKKMEIKKQEIDYTNFSETEIKVINSIKDGPIHCDMIAYKTGLDITTIMGILTILELKGVIKELTSRTFIIC